MKKSEIEVGVTYSTKNGSAARKVLQIGLPSETLPRPRWMGSDHREPPADALLVEYEQVRGPGQGRKEIVFLDAFAVWAAKVDSGKADVVADLIAVLEAIQGSADLLAIHDMAARAVARATA